MDKTPNPKMQTCESSQVAEHGYCPDTQTLRVRFKSGGSYDYLDVPPEKYKQMQESDSVGKFLHANIKPHHGFKKLSR